MPDEYHFTGVSTNVSTPANFDDARKLCRQLPPSHPEDGAAQKYVFPARELRMKPGPDLDQRRQTTLDR